MKYTLTTSHTSLCLYLITLTARERSVFMPTVEYICIALNKGIYVCTPYKLVVHHSDLRWCEEYTVLVGLTLCGTLLLHRSKNEEILDRQCHCQQYTGLLRQYSRTYEFYGIGVERQVPGGEVSTFILLFSQKHICCHLQLLALRRSNQ